MLSGGLIGPGRATAAECEEVNGSGGVPRQPPTTTPAAHTLYPSLNGHGLNRSDPQRSARNHHGNGGSTLALTTLGDE